jgi:NTP pyrophosphatase (non-canonical NTP hydrolase)
MIQKLFDYERQVEKNLQNMQFENARSDHPALVYAVMCLAGETGEVIEPLKKYMFQGHDLNRHEILNELGDCLFAITKIAHCLGYSLEDIINANMTKMQKRYPNGFTTENSLDHPDEK